MTGKPLPVVVVGDVMTDIIVTPEGPLVRGSDRRAAIRSKPGGSGANQAVWLGSMQVPVRFAARVGAADVVGLTSYFKGFGVEARLAADATAPSGVLITMVDPDGERSFLTDRGANLNLSAGDLKPELLDGTAALVLSGYSFFAETPRLAVMALAKAALTRGLKVHVDPASAGFLAEVGVAQFLGWTQGASTLFANAEEAEMLSGETDLAAQMRALGRHYERVIIKRGNLGAALGDRNGIRHTLPAPTVTVRDTTGAGDAFAAGFLAAELSGHPPETCLTTAIAAGSAAVQHLGGQPEISQ